jgi:hypothetical protein
MILEHLKLSLYELLGIGCARTPGPDLAVMTVTTYIVWFEEPLIGILYRLGWSERKPIALIELGEMFDLEDLGLGREGLSWHS